MNKSADAFRTIREVADWLGVAAHVLRFWESKFPQVKPVKRAGGRRYYRPADMELLGGIKVLLHDQGMTVRGVQRLLREEGTAAVAALSPPLENIEAAPDLVEGIAETEEASWHADAAADRTRSGDGAQTAPPEAERADTDRAPLLPGFDRPEAGERAGESQAARAAAHLAGLEGSEDVDAAPDAAAEAPGDAEAPIPEPTGTDDGEPVDAAGGEGPVGDAPPEPQGAEPGPAIDALADAASEAEAGETAEPEAARADADAPDAEAEPDAAARSADADDVWPETAPPEAQAETDTDASGEAEVAEASAHLLTEAGPEPAQEPSPGAQPEPDAVMSADEDAAAPASDTGPSSEPDAAEPPEPDAGPGPTTGPIFATMRGSDAGPRGRPEAAGPPIALEGEGLDALAHLAARAGDLSPAHRARLVPAMSALRALQSRIAAPVGPAGDPHASGDRL
jgi:DNA-binding transcriptional MerR regulator